MSNSQMFFIEIKIYFQRVWISIWELTNQPKISNVANVEKNFDGEVNSGDMQRQSTDRLSQNGPLVMFVKSRL